MKRLSVCLVALLILSNLNRLQAQDQKPEHPIYFSAHILPFHFPRKRDYGYAFRAGYSISQRTAIGLSSMITGWNALEAYGERTQDLGVFLDYLPHRSKYFDVILCTETGYGRRWYGGRSYPYIHLHQFVGARLRFNPYFSARIDIGIGGSYTEDEPKAFTRLPGRIGIELTF